MAGGYMMLITRCIACKATFCANPDIVPSIRVRFVDGVPVADRNGSREPLCRSCFERRQELRAEQGLPREHLAPGAYEPAPEMPDG